MYALKFSKQTIDVAYLEDFFNDEQLELSQILIDQVMIHFPCIRSAWNFPCWKNTTRLMVKIMPRKIRLDHQKTFTWFTQWVVPKLVLEWYFQQAIQSPHVHGVLACLEHRDVLVSEAHWGLFTEEFLFITCTVYRKTFWKFFMDYVSSTYLISINCFRMLRLMNKKDSGLFGGPESETETDSICLSWKNPPNEEKNWWINIYGQLDVDTRIDQYLNSTTCLLFLSVVVNFLIEIALFEDFPYYTRKK